MGIQDKQMLSELIIESRDHLSAVEPDLLELEQKGAAVSDDLINRVFRAVHSIKGGFGFFGIEKITRLSHVMENALSRVRDKTLSVTSELVDALLTGVDRLRLLLDDVENTEHISIEAELARLLPFIPAEPGGSERAAEAGGGSSQLELERDIRRKHPNLTDTMISGAIRNGKRLYQVILHSHADIAEKHLTPIGLFNDWEKFGEILDIAFDFDAITGLKGSAGHDLTYSVILASVLDPDLISTATGISSKQIHSLETAELRAELLKKQNAAAAEVQKTPQPEADPQAAAGDKTVPDGIKTETHIEDSLRVKVALLNKLMNLAGELVLSRNQLLQRVNRGVSESFKSDRIFKEFDRQVKHSCESAAAAILRDSATGKAVMKTESQRIMQTFRQSLNFKIADLPGIHAIIQNIDLVTSMLQEGIMQTRLQPISVLFSKFPRIIRDLTKKCGKEVDLNIVGQEVELDKSIIELLSDPLTHLIRNSIDHGIELPEKRLAAGKKRLGTVLLRAYHEGGKVNIQIRDDGGGINTVKVKQKAVEKGIITAAAADAMSEIEINRIILAAGFSTADKVTDVSGRGVGMDVVKSNIERLGGTIDISSVFGHGTTITMQLPLTLAIIAALVVTAENRRFAIPQVSIEELVRVRANDLTRLIEQVGRSEVCRLRGGLLPLVRLTRLLGITATFVDPLSGDRKQDNRGRWSDRRGTPDHEHDVHARNPLEQKKERRGDGADRRTNIHNAIKIVVIRAGENRFGLVVDEVFDSEEIVVKPLSVYFKSCGCYAGATIMGDGTVAMILDANGLTRLADLKFGDLEKAESEERERFAKEQNRDMQDILLFDNGAEERLGVDLSRVARIEKIETSCIEHVGSREFVRYEKSTLPLIRLQNFLPIAPPRENRGHQFVIVPKTERNPVGIAVESVHDVIRTELVIDTETVKEKGLVGSAVLNERMTLIVDLPGLLEEVGKR